VGFNDVAYFDTQKIHHISRSSKLIFSENFVWELGRYSNHSFERTVTSNHIGCRVQILHFRIKQSGLRHPSREKLDRGLSFVSLVGNFCKLCEVYGGHSGHQSLGGFEIDTLLLAHEVRVEELVFVCIVISVSNHCLDTVLATLKQHIEITSMVNC